MRYRVLAAAGLLVLLVASWAGALAQAPTPAPVFRETKQAGDLSLTLTVAPATGDQGALVYVQDAAGQPVVDASVVLSFVMPSMTMTTAPVSAVHSGSGRYDAAVPFSMAGIWQVQVAATPLAGDPASATFELEVREGVPLPSRPAPSLADSLLTSWTKASAVLLALGLVVLIATQLLLKTRRAAGFIAGWLMLLSSLGLCVIPFYAAAMQDNPQDENRPASIARARPIYELNCLPCHGPAGRGDGPAARSLNPRPADLTADHVEAHPDGQIFTWIRDGFPGSAMPAFGQQLTSDQIWDLVTYVRSFREQPEP
jgi:mono/diheme cytochrome c family protein